MSEPLSAFSGNTLYLDTTVLYALLRGWPELKVRKLREYVQLCRDLDLPINVGTEMNSPGNKFVLPADGMRPLPLSVTFSPAQRGVASPESVARPARLRGCDQHPQRARVLAQQVVQPPARRARQPFGPGDVLALRLARPELRAQRLGRGPRAGEDDQPRGVAVDPVDDRPPAARREGQAHRRFGQAVDRGHGGGGEAAAGEQLDAPATPRLSAPEAAEVFAQVPGVETARVNFTVTIEHTETTNTNDPIASRDIITLPSTEQVVNIAGVDYTVVLLGFKDNTGAIVNTIYTNESSSSNNFGIWGVIRSSQNRILKALVGAWVDVIRGTPFLVQVFIIFFILPEFGIQLEAFPAAVIALTNLAACFICEIVAAGIQAVPWGQREAAISTGLNWHQQLRNVIMPQAMRVILPPLVGQYVLLIKDSSVVSAIGVVDVTRVGWLTVQRIPQGLLVFGLVALLYFIICYPLIQLSNSLEKRMSSGYSRGKL